MKSETSCVGRGRRAQHVLPKLLPRKIFVEERKRVDVLRRSKRRRSSQGLLSEVYYTLNFVGTRVVRPEDLLDFVRARRTRPVETRFSGNFRG